MVVALVAVALALFFDVILRLPAPAWSWRFVADPRRSCCAVILTTILPGIDATVLGIVVAIAAIVRANAAIRLAAARRAGFGSSRRGRAKRPCSRRALVYLAGAVLSQPHDFDPDWWVFFAFL
jgi:hypothetical protein